MNYISMTRQEFIETLKQAYGIKNDDQLETGCYINGKWFSIADVTEAIFNP